MAHLVAEHRLPSGQVLRLVHGDLTQEAVDAIVNAANAHLAHGGGVAGAIVRRGGASIQAESDAWIRAHGPVPHDRPAVTGAGRLPCRYVIHAVGPVWGEGDEDAKLAAAVTGALRAAAELDLASIALPAISTGIFGFPKDRGARVILESTLAFCASQSDTSLREIHVTLIDEPTLHVFADEFRRRWPDSLSLP
jgi:O-acetyl-ADP-ribose deacetylase (regulator of RNase III)